MINQTVGKEKSNGKNLVSENTKNVLPSVEEDA